MGVAAVFFGTGGATGRDAQPTITIRVVARDYGSKAPGAPHPPPDTVVSRVRPGQGIGGPRSAHYFGLVRLMGPDCAMVEFSEVSPLGFLEVADSIPVSTIPRRFSTLTTDAGTSFELTVLADHSKTTTDTSGVRVSVRARSRRHETIFEQLVHDAELVVLARLVEVAPGDTLPGPPVMAGAESNLRFLVSETWKGYWRPSDTLLVCEPGGTPTGQSWAPVPTATPMFVGDRVMLVLGRRWVGRQLPGLWFEPFYGYGLFASGTDLTFGAFGRGVPLSHLRQRVWGMTRTLEPGSGKVLGNLVAADGHPIMGCRVAVSEATSQATSDSSGWFELDGVPIGHRSLRVTGPRIREGHAILAVSDEWTDTLVVAVSPIAGR